MLLFLCGSVYQLINCINIKVNLYPDTPADIVLLRGTDFSAIEQAVRDSQVFDEVIATEWGEQGKRGDLGNSVAENTKIMQNAKDHPLALKTGKKYTDIFVSCLVYSYIYLIYYQMVQEGVIPKMHFFEDGTSSYMEEFIWINRSNIDHSVFPKEQRIINNLEEWLLYEPSLVVGAKRTLPCNNIPKTPEDIERIKPYIYKIFGVPVLPKEKYIFFDEPFSTEGLNDNLIDILDRIAEWVGKDNIIVKVHPRSKYDTYSMSGYKTFESQCIPWEVYSCADNIENKVLISVSSNCCFNPKHIFDQDYNGIYLYKVMTLSKRAHLRYKNGMAFFDKLYKVTNKDKKHLYVPNSMEALECCIKYLEGEVNG